ncbi:hypothetical protein ZWY2020_036268 [Hordeum vulgare]|nr:hypothetical protein ZWY2020_036268 [Hordeum vulgare]
MEQGWRRRGEMERTRESAAEDHERFTSALNAGQPSRGSTDPHWTETQQFGSSGASHQARLARPRATRAAAAAHCASKPTQLAAPFRRLAWRLTHDPPRLPTP